MVHRAVYNIKTRQLEWFINGLYLTSVEVQPYYDKLYNIDHQVKSPFSGDRD